MSVSSFSSEKSSLVLKAQRLDQTLDRISRCKGRNDLLNDHKLRHKSVRVVSPEQEGKTELISYEFVARAIHNVFKETRIHYADLSLCIFKTKSGMSNVQQLFQKFLSNEKIQVTFFLYSDLLQEAAKEYVLGTSFGVEINQNLKDIPIFFSKASSIFQPYSNGFPVDFLRRKNHFIPFITPQEMIKAFHKFQHSYEHLTFLRSNLTIYDLASKKQNEIAQVQWMLGKFFNSWSVIKEDLRGWMQYTLKTLSLELEKYMDSFPLIKVELEKTFEKPLQEHSKQDDENGVHVGPLSLVIRDLGDHFFKNEFPKALKLFEKTLSTVNALFSKIPKHDSEFLENEKTACSELIKKMQETPYHKTLQKRFEAAKTLEDYKKVHLILIGIDEALSFLATQTQSEKSINEGLKNSTLKKIEMLLNTSFSIDELFNYVETLNVEIEEHELLISKLSDFVKDLGEIANCDFRSELQDNAKSLNSKRVSTKPIVENTKKPIVNDEFIQKGLLRLKKASYLGFDTLLIQTKENGIVSLPFKDIYEELASVKWFSESISSKPELIEEFHGLADPKSLHAFLKGLEPTLMSIVQTSSIYSYAVKGQRKYPLSLLPDINSFDLEAELEKLQRLLKMANSLINGNGKPILSGKVRDHLTSAIQEKYRISEKRVKTVLTFFVEQICNDLQNLKSSEKMDLLSKEISQSLNQNQYGDVLKHFTKLAQMLKEAKDEQSDFMSRAELEIKSAQDHIQSIKDPEIRKALFKELERYRFVEEKLPAMRKLSARAQLIKRALRLQKTSSAIVKLEALIEKVKSPEITRENLQAARKEISELAKPSEVKQE